MMNGLQSFFSLLFILSQLSAVLATPTEETNCSEKTVTTSDDLLRNLKRGLFSADSILYHSKERILQAWAKVDATEYASIYDVIVDLSKLMVNQQTFKTVLNDKEADNEDEMDILVTKTLLDAVMEDACDWLVTVIAVDGFNCTSLHLERIVAQITVQQSIDEIKVGLNKYKKLNDVGSCNWIRCKFWCNTEFRSTVTSVNSTAIIEYMREYNDATCEDFSQDSCFSCHI